jgi:hypothetical protein
MKSLVLNLVSVITRTYIREVQLELRVIDSYTWVRLLYSAASSRGSRMPSSFPATARARNRGFGTVTRPARPYKTATESRFTRRDAG